MSFTSKTSGRGRLVNGSAYRDGEVTARLSEAAERNRSKDRLIWLERGKVVNPRAAYTQHEKRERYDAT